MVHTYFLGGDVDAIYWFSIAVRSVAAPSEAITEFDDMVSGTKRKYYMLGGKGGVGKTSCAASLAVKFANNGHPTLVVSTDPAHSLSDSFAQVLISSLLVFSLVFLYKFLCI